jgi:glycosyltransferase involved in cell wall biosynthesis
MVLAEAMAAGVPVVASSSGAIPEVLDGAGRQFVPGDWLGLADALAETIAEPPTAERAAAAARRAGELSTRAAAARLAAAYDELLAGRPR